MASPLPPDPYVALGVSKSCDASAVKSAYRKLALRCHPDKVADEALKARAADEFHKIQQAYEILIDDERRERYDSQVRLAELRREAMEGRGSGSIPRVEVRTAAYEVRTPGGATYTERGPSRVFEERRPREYEEERYYEQSRASSRKYDGYEPSYGRRSSTRTDREPVTPVTREKESDKTDRAERTRARDKDVRRERVRKSESTAGYSDDSDGRGHFEHNYHRRSEDAARYQQDIRKGSERKISREDYYGDVERKTFTAQDYIERSRQGSYDDARPPPNRAASARDPQAYEIRPSRGSERPAYVRRSSAQPKSSSRRRSPERERRRDVIAEEDEYSPRPALEKSNSDPTKIKMAAPPLRTRIQRSQTYQADDHAQPVLSGIPDMRRAETMPVSGTAPGAASLNSTRRRGVTQPAQPSKLRTARETMHDSGYSSSSPGAPETSYPQAHESPRPGLDRSASKTTYYSYPGGGVSVKPNPPPLQTQDPAYRTVTREPEWPSKHSPENPISPLTRSVERPPMGTARTVPTPAPASGAPGRYATATATASPSPASSTPGRSTSYAFTADPLPRPPMGRNASYNKEYADPEPAGRGRDRERDMLYGEQYSDYHYGRRDRAREQPTSYAPEDVTWAKPIDHKDVRFSARRRDEAGGVPRPGMPRKSETFVY